MNDASRPRQTFLLMLQPLLPMTARVGPAVCARVPFSRGEVRATTALRGRLQQEVLSRATKDPAKGNALDALRGRRMSEKSGGQPQPKYTQRWILIASDLWRRSRRSVVTRRAWGGGRFRPGDEALFGFFYCLDRRARARALVDRAQGRPICARSCGDVSRAFWQSAPSDRSRCTPSVLACPVPLARKPYGSSRCAWLLPPLSPR
jgi:hypothetical protein